MIPIRTPYFFFLHHPKTLSFNERPEYSYLYIYTICSKKNEIKTPRITNLKI